MEEVIRENTGDIRHNTSENLVREGVRRIERDVVDYEKRQSHLLFEWMHTVGHVLLAVNGHIREGNAPGGCVPRHVELWHHTNAAVLRIPLPLLINIQERNDRAERTALCPAYQ